MAGAGAGQRGPRRGAAGRRADLAVALSNIAALRRDQGDLSGAREALAKALRIRRMLAMRGPLPRPQSRHVARRARLRPRDPERPARGRRRPFESVALQRALAAVSRRRRSDARLLGRARRRRPGSAAAAAGCSGGQPRSARPPRPRPRMLWAIRQRRLGADLASLRIELGMLTATKATLAGARSAARESRPRHQGLRATNPNNAV